MRVCVCGQAAAQAELPPGFAVATIGGSAQIAGLTDRLRAELARIEGAEPAAGEYSTTCRQLHAGLRCHADASLRLQSG